MKPLLLLALIALLAPGILRAQDETDNAVHAVTTLHPDGTKTVTITDPDKKSSESTTYDAREKVTQKIIYTLDENHQPATGVIYTAAGTPVYKAAYKRDGMGRVSEEDDYTTGDQLLRRFVYEFGADGKVVRIRAYDAQGREMQASVAQKDPHRTPPRRH